MLDNTEFETVFREAFIDATGTDVDEPQVQAKRDLFIRHTAAETLDAWTQKPLRTGITSLTTSKSLDNSHIVHPSQAEFSEADIETIAKVRFLGRAAIDTAKQQLMQNQRFSRLRERDTHDIYDYFQAYYWHEVHPTAPDTNDAEDSGAASPLRLATWPYGENINCLGMSIGMAAASELFGLTYAYGNEVRNSQSVIAEQHDGFMRQVRRLIPTFDNGTIQVILQQTMHQRREPDEKYDDILFKTPPILQVRDKVRDFHHFVICEYPDNKFLQDAWVQVDPYDLSFGYLAPHRRQIDLALSPVFEKGNENSIVLSDEYRMVAAFYRQLSIQLQRAHERGSELTRRSQDHSLYKTSQSVERLYQSAETIAVEVMGDLFGHDLPEDAEGVARAKDVELFKDIYLNSLFTFAYNVPEANELIRRTDRRNVTNEIMALDKGVEKIIAREIGYDSTLRDEFVKLTALLPLLCIIHIYEYNLKANLAIREVGDAAPVMEIADPEFMIGAMYLNHYATWRKNGRINVARHLSRICSSQLLWQAARQDETECDDRIAAMGEVIKRLKPRQLHPLVNIASGIPTPSR